MRFSHDPTFGPEMINRESAIRDFTFAIPAFSPNQVDELRAQLRPIRGLLEQFCELGLVRPAIRNALLDNRRVARPGSRYDQTAHLYIAHVVRDLG
jgi:hypothetical protein